MAYSRFNYLGTSGLAELIPTMSGVTDHAIAADFISDAERMIDAYVGGVPRFYCDLTGTFSATLPSGTLIVSGSSFGDRRRNYWAVGGHYLTIKNSTETSVVGAKRLIVASVSGTVTLASGFGVNVPSGAEYVTSQVSRFPRWCDSDPWGSPELPDALAQAVAYQVEYAIAYGSESYGLGDDAVVTGDDELVTNRSYGSGYSEGRRAEARQGLAAWVAPKVRAILRGLINAVGYLS